MSEPKPVFDLSFGWPTITGAKIKAAGAGGVIAYTGCLMTTKNVSKARVQDWRDSGLMVGLVVEDFAGDAIGGEKVGRDQGQRVADAADALGYDVANCVLFGGYDTDAHPGDYNHLLDYMVGFHQSVPVPGYYGDSDSIDYLFAHGPRLINWQSSSASFSPKNPTPNAHLHQRFADPRAHGLDVDVNDVLKVPLRLMGEQEDMPLTNDEWAKLRGVVQDELADALRAVLTGQDSGAYTHEKYPAWVGEPGLRDLAKRALSEDDIKRIASNVAKAVPGASQDTVEAAIKAVLLGGVGA